MTAPSRRRQTKAAKPTPKPPNDGGKGQTRQQQHPQTEPMSDRVRAMAVDILTRRGFYDAA